MGGNALAKFGVERISAAEFEVVSVEVLSLLQSMFPRVRFDVVPSYRDKPSHGDLDILYSWIDGFDTDVIGGIKREYKPIGYDKNGSAFSFTYKMGCGKLLQTDLIRTDPDLHEMALSYFSYNDLGNLLGRVYHAAGFSLGHQGLSYTLRLKNDTQFVAKLILTTNWKQALEFMEYKNYHETVFNTLEDVFRYSVTSPFVNSIMYSLETRNHAAKIRDIKRPTYTKFLQWLKDNPGVTAEFDWTKQAELREQFLEKAFSVFPEFKREYDLVMIEAEKSIVVKSKFNGLFVSEITGLSGQELGNFIKRFKESLNVDFREYVLATGTKELKTDILNLFHQTTVI